MKIGHSAEKPTPPAAPAAVAATNGSTTAAVAVGTGAIPALADASATLELSNTASTLLNGGTTAEFDAEKVARISKSIEDGSFKINPEAIADKLISNAQELLTKAQP